MAYNQVGVSLAIIETSVFSRQVQSLLSDEEYRELQMTLVINPSKGDLIPGSGRLRKVRWVSHGIGKRGGSRIIYYWAPQQDQIMMLMIYGKSEQDNLTQAQLKVLREIIEREYP